MEEIKINGTISLEDKGARQWLSQLQSKIDTINERTKQHTKDIQELRRELKK